MKKLIVYATLVLASTAFAELKIGTVDMVTLVKEHPSYEQNKKFLQDTEREYRQKAEVAQKDLIALQEKGQKLAADYKNPVISAAEKKRLEGELQKIEREFMEKQQAIQKMTLADRDKLAVAEARLLKLQAEDLKLWIAAFAKEGGYDFIFDVAAVPFAKEGTDVTDGVVKYMTSHPKKTLKEQPKNEGK